MALLDEYQVGIDGPWGPDQVAHLWRRAGFGALPEERDALAGPGDQAAFQAAVDTLIDFLADDPHLDQAAGSGTGTYGDPFADLPNDSTDLGRIKRAESKRDLSAHWLYRMRYTSQPLQEQLALFLHDHMVSEFTKVNGGLPLAYITGNDGSAAGQPCSSGTLPPDDNGKTKKCAALMKEQYDLFRHTGADDFRQLLIDITRNPAMLLYLDNQRNVNGRPQENYAREVMELFSMGVGNYSEQDVQSIAECLTGERMPFLYSCPNDFSSAYGFDSIRHEAGNKTVFSQTVTFSNSGGETTQVIDLILNKVSINPAVSGLANPYNDLPAPAVYISWKLLNWFVSHDIVLLPAPDDVVLELADYFRGSDGNSSGRRYPFDVRAALRKIFRSKFFFSSENLLAMYKNPADFVITALRMLELPESFTNGAGPVVRMQLMGMDLLEPPNVAGWEHGKSWISSGSLIQRYNYANRISEVVLAGAGGDAYANALLQANGGPIADETDHENMIEYFRDRLLQTTISQEEHDLLIDFLVNVPGANAQQRLTRKVRGIIHVMMSMPACQLK
jgi:uncharacterized protein (DUF1800 family)